MKREDVVKDRIVVLTQECKSNPNAIVAMPVGTRGFVSRLEPGEEDIEDYVMVRFEGMSYFTFVPISALELADVLTNESDRDVADCFIAGPHSRQANQLKGVVGLRDITLAATRKRK